MNREKQQFDAIIVGAGIAGSALACALGGSSLRVAIIEAAPLPLEWPEQDDTINGFDGRVSALTLSSQNFLRNLSVWSEIVQRRVSPYNKMQVWDGEGTGSICFLAEEINQPALGHIVENRITIAALVKQFSQYANVQSIAPAKLEQIFETEHGRELILEDGRVLQAPLIVAADGANSFVRHQAGFETREWDYHHHAIVATVQVTKPHHQTARQRFLPQGPLAFLPLNSGTGEQHLCSIVWSATPQYAKNLMELSDDEFAVALAQAFEYELGDVQKLSRRTCFPLRQRHATDYVKPGIALIADAAHTIHPLAGQGINLGLMDVKVLAEELLRGKSVV